MTNQTPIRTAVYVDGFNFYYWLKPLPYRWIDLKALALNAIRKPDKQHVIVAVKYFTARVSDTRDDPNKSTRQDIYIRALQATIPELTVYYGEFRRQKKHMPRVDFDGGVGKLIQVWDTEEKGSDVNLAVELVHDAWSNLYDMAIVISNDSDLERAVTIVKRKGRVVGVLVRGDAEVNSLKRVSSFLKNLTEVDLFNALLPREIPGTKLRIPYDWIEKEDEAKIR
jgi:NYN domain